MSRWQPDTPRRLALAALELFEERGYEATTVADIAARADLTKRTFFRHYADKREVLFGGSADLDELLTSALAAAPTELAPLDAVVYALAAGSAFFDDERRPYARRRQHLIATHRDLQERELVKLASLANTLAGTLRERGVREPAATLGAETGITVFKLAFEQWVAGNGDYAALVAATADDLRAVALR